MPVSPKGLCSWNVPPLGCLGSVLKIYHSSPSLLIRQFSGVNNDKRVSHRLVSLRTCIHARIGLSSPSGNLIALGASFFVSAPVLPVRRKSPVRGVHSDLSGVVSPEPPAVTLAPVVAPAPVPSSTNLGSGSMALSKLPSEKLRRQRPRNFRAALARVVALVTDTSHDWILCENIEHLPSHPRLCKRSRRIYGRPFHIHADGGVPSAVWYAYGHLHSQLSFLASMKASAGG